MKHRLRQAVAAASILASPDGAEFLYSARKAPAPPGSAWPSCSRLPLSTSRQLENIAGPYFVALPARGSIGLGRDGSSSAIPDACGLSWSKRDLQPQQRTGTRPPAKAALLRGEERPRGSLPCLQIDL